jgi:hypothetical protein
MRLFEELSDGSAIRLVDPRTFDAGLRFLTFEPASALGA